MSVSYFKNAKHVVANNTTFKFKATYVTFGVDALQLLCKHSATGAMHDSKERYPFPTCHPGTRAAIFIRIANWYGYHNGPGKRVMLVHAPAGYGKTAIAGTVSRMLEQEADDLDFSPLAATFFFSRTSPERNNPDRLIITIAYQLAISIPKLAPHIKEAVNTHPMIVNKTLEKQLAKLIIEPFRSLGEIEGMPTRLVVIDGLDECINPVESCMEEYSGGQDDAQIRVLNLIHTLQSHSLPLSFLIFSRPEPWIKQHIESRLFTEIVEVVDLYADGDHMNDGEKYIRSELSRIAAKIGEHGWPEEDVIQRFVWRTKGCMLYASTVIRRLDNPHDDPQKRLEEILDSPSNSLPELEGSLSSLSLSTCEPDRQILRSRPAAKVEDGILAPLKQMLTAKKVLETVLKEQSLQPNGVLESLNPLLVPHSIGILELVDTFFQDESCMVNSDNLAKFTEIATRLVAMTPKPNPNVRPYSPVLDQRKPREMLKYLSTYHVIFIVDDSTSMIMTDNYSAWNDDRWRQAQNSIAPITDLTFKHNLPNVDLGFMHYRRNMPFRGIQVESNVSRIFHHARPPQDLSRIRSTAVERTPTGAALKFFVDEAINELNSKANNPEEYKKIRPTDIIVLTDGEADDNPKALLAAARNELERHKHNHNYIGIQFVQIGNSKATKLKLAEITEGESGTLADFTPSDGTDLSQEKLAHIMLKGMHPTVLNESRSRKSL